MIRQIDALMITVEPGHSIAHVGELCLMTPYHYLVTPESETHFTHIPRIDMNSPDVLVREVKDPNTRGIFRVTRRHDVIGSEEEGLKQIFSCASEYSSLIIEYVQRFGDIQGFFTKDDVARLTHAAGVEEDQRELDAEARALGTRS